MAVPITIRRNPALIIRNLLATHALVISLYILAAVLYDYEGLYKTLPLIHIFSYEVAKILFISGIELCLIVAIFIQWLATTYYLWPDKIIEERGLIFKKNTTTTLSPKTSISFYQNIFGKVFNYGTIVIDQPPQPSYHMDHITDPHHYQSILHNGFAPHHTTDIVKSASLAQLLASPEHEQLEFKSSLRWDWKEQRLNRNLEKSTLKTIAAFLNSRGGHLILGVGDGKQYIGLAADYATLPRKDADGFEAHLTNLIKTAIGHEFRQCVDVSFSMAGEHELCWLKITSAPKPAYYSLNNEEALYIRMGNVSNALPINKIAGYVESRWERD